MLHTRPMAGNVSSGGKQGLRKELEARRRALSPQDVQAKSGEVLRHFAALPFFQSAKVVALYVAQPFEVQTQGLIALAGARVVLPRVVAKGQPLAMHRAPTAGALVPGTLGLLEPGASTPTVSPAEIDLWVLPGVGFTPSGVRLGRGAGYYDLTLAAARRDAVKVGLCFTCCLVDQLPSEPHDVAADLVVSEERALRCQRT
jgi:5-formyltetrahydrofolate cyclo-ligase